MEYQKQIKHSNYDVVIVGAGMSGLVCAVRLVHAGLSVLVLEQHYAPGGATSSFRRKGFTFEAAAHRVTGIRFEGSPFYDLLNLIGRQVRISPLNPSYVVHIGDRRLNADLDLRTYRDNLVELFPDQQNAIDAFLEDMLKMKMAVEYLFQKKGKPDPDVLSSKHPLFVDYARKTTKEYFQNRFSDPDIIDFLAILGNLTTLPMEEQSFSTFSGIWSVSHTGEGRSLIVGGFQTLVDTLVEYIDSHGGEVVVKKLVDQILVKNGCALGIATKDGEEIKAKVVISAASNEQTYLRMLSPKVLPTDFLQEIKSNQPSGSVFQVYLGVKESSWGDLEHCTVFGWGNSDPLHYKRIENWDIDAITSKGIITFQGKDMSPPGYRSLNISCLCPYHHPENWFMKGDDKAAYRKFKENLANKLIQNMSKYIPDLESRIEYIETATPLTLERYTLATGGAVHGLAYTVAQSGPQRGALKTPVENLYHVGQYVFPGAGVKTVAISANTCASMVLEKHFKRS
jgi:phytoene desaturase